MRCSETTNGKDPKMTTDTELETVADAKAWLDRNGFGGGVTGHQLAEAMGSFADIGMRALIVVANAENHEASERAA